MSVMENIKTSANPKACRDGQAWMKNLVCYVGQQGDLTGALG